MNPQGLVLNDIDLNQNGTRNIFVDLELLAGKCRIKVTHTRKKSDLAHFIKELVDGDYRWAKKVRLVLDNLNTHFFSSFYETFLKEANFISGVYLLKINDTKGQYCIKLNIQ